MILPGSGETERPAVPRIFLFSLLKNEAYVSPFPGEKEGKNKICYLFFFLVWLYVPEKAPRIISEERSCVGVTALIPTSFCFPDMEVDL